MQRKLYRFSLFFLILGLALGVFYREFTKYSAFTGTTALSVLHTHTLVLGFLMFLLLLVLERLFELSAHRSFTKSLVVYLIGLLGLIGTLGWRGILQVQGGDFAGLPHISGTFHLILAVGLVWIMLILKKRLKNA